MASLAVLPDGDVLLSGSFNLGGNDRNLYRVHPDGSGYAGFPYAYGGGKLTAWQDRFYVGNGQAVRRIWPDGVWDSAFIGVNTGPYFSTLQGGDYFVYPDGRIILSGDHLLSDSIRGFEGHYNLIWFSNEGYLDTTQQHRACDGFVEDIFPLPDGKFLLSGSWSVYDGRPVPNSTRLIRVFADGALDTTFAAPIWWGNPNNHTLLPDGKHLLGGAMQVYGIPNDTIGWVRLYPNGALDTTFNNSLPLLRSYSSDPSRSGVNGLMVLDDTRYVITGAFDLVDGQVRGAIALVDSSGHLLDDYFTGTGCGMFDNNGIPAKNLAGITPGLGGEYYIYGAYHGYDDGTTNYTGQRMVSRLYGLDVGVPNEESAEEWMVAPNPSDGHLVLRSVPGLRSRTLQVLAANGQLEYTKVIGPNRTETVDLSHLVPGMHVLHLMDADGNAQRIKLLIQPR